MIPKPTQKTKPLNFPFQLIRKDLSAVESQLKAQVQAFDPGIEPYISYICDTAGKRIRPALTLLVGGATGEMNENHLKLGVVLELIHMATLVHDDIIDGADKRRKMATPNAKWGNGMAVLLGDALFSHALALSTEFNCLTLSRKIGLASREVCQGEILQTQRRFDLKFSKKEYFRLIQMKTGVLFAAATELSARLSGCSEEVQASFHDFGMKLGTAYQIYDDCLDLVGTEDKVGKTLRTDLEKGKLTLPILNLLEESNVAQRNKLQKRIINQEPLDLDVLVGIADYDGAIDKALNTAQDLIEEARDILKPLEPSDYSEALYGILIYLESLLLDCRQS